MWESIARELNSLLREQELTSIRAAAQCKTKIKSLGDKYKRVKDHNSKSGNDRESFAYYEELNEILGCRAKISPKTVVECDFIDDNSAIPGPSLEELSESGDDESIRDGEEQTLSEAFFRREPAAKKGRKCFATMPNSSKQKGPKSAKSAESGDELRPHIFAAIFFRINAEAMETRLVRRLVQQPSLQLKKKTEKRNRVATQNILPSYMKAKNATTIFLKNWRKRKRRGK